MRPSGPLTSTRGATTLLHNLLGLPLGIVCLIAAGWIPDGMGRWSRQLARWGAR